MKNEIEFKFGDYAIIEQKRHGVPNEMFVHKVVGQLRSNTWVDVPVRVPATEALHGEMEDICLCICCGIDETEVRRYRVKDMRRHSPVSLVADEKRGSTITQQAVNELIKSLESAGELSIKETKVMELAKAYQQLAAENARYSMSAGHADQRMAESRAVRSALGFKPDADDVSPSDLVEAINQIVAELCVIRTAHPQPLGPAMDAAIDAFNAEEMPETGMLNSYFILRESIRIKTPATDRIVAGIKADGVEGFVSNTVHKIFDESDAVSALAYLSLANSHVKQLREGADK
ncbi:TPA: hypothetical protein MJF28_002578 [Klebsiella pneumoniae]|nr:hypothetical protein [Klebsiella pneumoniae]HBY8841231.1 hypothetical protein [Klebsiella pneumoniae]HBY9129248.1 hypothetical protein [Klebsiella pneumoniae]HBY9135104.1 hypothetical protein [Klebsiella pneumoniae]HBZ0046559.1 hypothetical protein [Klebsiella pneumoniae]